MQRISLRGQAIDMGNYDEQEGLLSLNGWMELYQKKTGKTVNAGSMRKRRFMSGLGTMVPPRTYLLTREEYEQVMDTPLPMCKNVIKAQRND